MGSGLPTRADRATKFAADMLQIHKRTRTRLLLAPPASRVLCARQQPNEYAAS